MRRTRRFIVVSLAAGAIAAFGLAMPAGAYPVGVNPIVTVNSGATNPDGVNVTVTCTNFDPGSTCTVVVNSNPVTLGTLTVGASGNVSGNFLIPCSIGNGQHTVVASGTSNGTTASASSVITIANCATGGLAFTGSNSTPWAAAGIGLVLAGLVLAVMANRRRTAPSLTS